MKIVEALRAGADAMAQAGVEEPVLESEFLMAGTLETPRLNLALMQERPLDAAAWTLFERGFVDRCQHHPLAYILGEQPFMELSIKVNPSVLIPRPETELLVEQARMLLDEAQGALVVDVGTGSGNIALALANHPRVARVIGIDISAGALAVAGENARRNPTRIPVEWIQGDLLGPLLEKPIPVDLIVGNLPYVRAGELSDLPEEVRHEPHIALDGGPDGLTLIRALIPQAERILKPGGWLLLEIGADQDGAVLQLLESAGVWEKVQMHRDLAGLPRIVQARRN